MHKEADEDRQAAKEERRGGRKRDREHGPSGGEGGGGDGERVEGVRDNDGGDAAAAAAAAAAVVGPVSGVGAELAEAGGNNAQGGGVEVGDMKDEEGTRAGGCQSLGRCVGNEPEVEVTVTVEGSEQKERGRDDAYNCEVGPGF